MLITLECVILALQAVAAVRVSLESPFESASQSINRLSKRSPVELDGDISRCFRIKLYANGINLGLQVNSITSDIIIPLSSSSNDLGLAIQNTPGGQPVTIKYKGKEYNGITSTADVTIMSTEITGVNLPVIEIEKESTDLVGIVEDFDGVLGIGYLPLSDYYPPVTAMDVLYNGGFISNNEVGLQLCPYEMLQESFINIGNTEITPKCGTDGKSLIWVNSPSDEHHAVNIKSILVNGKPVDLPEEFQQVVENGRILYSTIHTCYMYIRFPERVVNVLINSILDNSAITIKKTMLRDDRLDRKKIKKKLQKNRLMPKSNYNIDWDKMPSLSIVMFSQNPVTDENRNSLVTIRLGPRDYMQTYNFKNFRFTVTAGSNDRATLGIPFMTRLLLTFDRQNKRTGFGPGCGCETMADGYPIILNGDRVLWPLTQLPEQPSTSSSDGRSTLERSLSRLGSIRRGSKRSKVSYEKFEG
ncbi:hypothetical protein O5D80_003233 [Batrachochytrium dendrobatidis]|nr:hypothetical protein O5D80_003233 [Batrachochytrium dendrobatidis]